LFFPKATQINQPNSHYQAKYTQLITPATTYFLSLTHDPKAKICCKHHFSHSPTIQWGNGYFSFMLVNENGTNRNKIVPETITNKSSDSTKFIRAKNC
jgi:hypothetical protein